MTIDERFKVFDATVSALYRSGQSTYQIKELLKCTQGKIARSLKRSNTPRRDSIKAMHMRRSAA